jgi:hypothetical protein
LDSKNFFVCGSPIVIDLRIKIDKQMLDNISACLVRWLGHNWDRGDRGANGVNNGVTHVNHSSDAFWTYTQHIADLAWR